MNTAWIVFAKHLHEGGVRGHRLVGILDGTIGGKAMQSIVHEFYVAHLTQLSEVPEFPGRPVMEKITLPPDCRVKFGALNDGTVNESHVICVGWPNLHMEAVSAQNVALEVDANYIEHVRWSQQELIKKPNGDGYIGRWKDFSLKTNDMGNLEAIPHE